MYDFVETFTPLLKHTICTKDEMHRICLLSPAFLKLRDFI